MHKKGNYKKSFLRLAFIFKRYFPALMLVGAAVGTMLLAAFSFSSLSPIMIFGSAILAVVFLFTGLLQMHTAYEESSQLGVQSLDFGVGTNFLSQQDGNLTLASLSGMMHEGFVLVQNGRITYSNPAFAYILAAQEGELIGSRFSSYIHPDDVELLKLEDNLDPDAGPTRTTLRLTTRLGDVRWIICSVYKVVWQGEEVRFILCEDIGALKQAQSALEEQEQQSRILFERTPLGIAMFDAMGIMRLSNTAWRSTWSSVVGTGVRRFNILQDPFMPGTSIEKAVRQAFDKQECAINNYEHNTSWGETRWFDITFHPMLTPLDQLIGIAMIQQDITDKVRSSRRETELNDQLTALRMDIAHASSQLTKVIDELADVIICFDSDTKVTAWNAAATRRFGLTQSKAIGQPQSGLKEYLHLYMPYLQMLYEKNEASLPDVVHRVDATGPHFEKVRASHIRIGAQHLVMLVIKDITHFVLGRNMQYLLGLASGSGQLETGKEVNGLRALFEPIALVDVLNEFERDFFEQVPTVALKIENRQPELRVLSKAGILLPCLLNLAQNLNCPEQAQLDVTVGVENEFAVISFFCARGSEADMPMQGWCAEPTGLLTSKFVPGATESKMPLHPWHALASLGCIAASYSKPEGGAGIICRVPLEPGKKNLSESAPQAVH